MKDRFRRAIVVIASTAIGAFVFISWPTARDAGFRAANAVEAPSVESRDKAESGREKDNKGKAKKQKATGCPYGKDKKTGKCYQPKEGQFYRDSSGDIHRAETDCYNLPWKPCKGDSTPTKKSKGTEKKKK